MYIFAQSKSFPRIVLQKKILDEPTPLTELQYEDDIRRITLPDRPSTPLPLCASNGTYWLDSMTKPRILLRLSPCPCHETITSSEEIVYLYANPPLYSTFNCTCPVKLWRKWFTSLTNRSNQYGSTPLLSTSTTTTTATETETETTATQTTALLPSSSSTTSSISAALLYLSASSLSCLLKACLLRRKVVFEVDSKYFFGFG